MTITLYYWPPSIPCGLVLLTTRALNLDVELKSIDLLKLEQMKPEFLKLNPMHKVPTLVDGDIVLWESRTIARYLAIKHDSKLYPQELKARATVDQRLDFDLGTLYRRLLDYYFPYIAEQKPLEKANLVKLQEALGFLNTFLEGNQYVAGADLTIADFGIVASVAAIDSCDIDLKPYPEVMRWYKLMKSTVPGFEEAIQMEAFKSAAEALKNRIVKWYR